MKRLRLPAIVFVVLAFLAPRLRAADDNDREQALAAIKKLKGTVVKTPFSVSLDGKGVGDDALVHLQKLPDLEAAYLRNCKLTDAGLEKLAGLTKLKYLYLARNQITDKGLAHLKGLTKLQSLSLDGTQVTDEGLAQLKDLPALIVLELKGTKVTDAGVAELKKSLPKLTVRK